MEDRIDYLREETREGRNHTCRAPFKDTNEIRNTPGSLYFRKAKAAAYLMDHSPTSIADRELIVGTRTLLAPNPGNEDGHDTADYSVGIALPSYVNDNDVRIFGYNEQFLSKTHYTPDYGIVLNCGIGGILAQVKSRLYAEECNLQKLTELYPQSIAVRSCFEEQDTVDLPDEVLFKVREKKNGIEFLQAVIITWEAVSRFILRYEQKARMMAEKEKNANRRKELRRISEICAHISTERPADFYEAVQLFWFAHLCVLLESQEFINYGRVDVLLHPFLKDTPRDTARELLACLFMKMYDQADLKCSYLSRYGGQITMTLGGVDEFGENAVSETTFLLMDALDRVRLTEPLVTFKVNSKNPPEFLEKACALSQSGLNTIGIYNDDLFIDSLTKRDIPKQLANTYAFGLCQDITIAGYDDNSMGGSIAPIHNLMCYIKDVKDHHEYTDTFDQFYKGFKDLTTRVIDASLAGLYQTEKAFMAFRAGNPSPLFDGVREGRIAPNANCRSVMCPLPLLSALFHGCVETATDITLQGCELKTHGHYLFTPTVTINSLVAIKYAVYDKKYCTLQELWNALETDFAGTDGEILRQRLFHAPKWGNNDEYADSLCVDYLEFCMREVQKHDTAGGGKMLSGIHNPHPVPSGECLMATPDGRHAKAPLSVTLTPSNGTLQNGPLAALMSAAKFDHTLINWNFCIMLNYSASIFKENPTLLAQMIRTYFDHGGLQHQPNVCSVDDLRDAQIHPEKYPDLIVRLWGVSIRFIDINRTLQDEVIERFA